MWWWRCCGVGSSGRVTVNVSQDSHLSCRTWVVLSPKRSTSHSFEAVQILGSTRKARHLASHTHSCNTCRQRPLCTCASLLHPQRVCSVARSEPQLCMVVCMWRHRSALHHSYACAAKVQCMLSAVHVFGGAHGGTCIVVMDAPRQGKLGSSGCPQEWNKPAPTWARACCTPGYDLRPSQTHHATHNTHWASLFLCQPSHPPTRIPWHTSHDTLSHRFKTNAQLTCGA